MAGVGRCGRRRVADMSRPGGVPGGSVEILAFLSKFSERFPYWLRLRLAVLGPCPALWLDFIVA